MKRTLVLIYGVVAYVTFLGVFLYLVGFMGGFAVPKALDDGPVQPWAWALMVNIGLILLFGVQHSVMARPKFKIWLTRHIPMSAERSTYVLATNVVLVALYVWWQPIPGVIWSVENPVGRGLVYVVFGGGCLLVLYSTFLINHFDLFGLRHTVTQMRRLDYNPVPMKVVSLYRYVRNPMMLGMLIAVWAAPTMTRGHLLFSVWMSVYILIGVYFEERMHSRELGSEYHAYRERTPMLLPLPIGKRTQ